MGTFNQEEHVIKSVGINWRDEIERMLKMGAFISGPLLIRTVAGSANVNFGGALFVTPKNISKNFLGSGGGHTSVISFSFVGPSSTNTVDADVLDQPVALDN